MSRSIKPGDRVQFTRYWILHHSLKGAPRVPHTLDDVGVVLKVVRSIYANKDAKYVKVRWLNGPARPDSNVRIDALEHYGTPRELTRYPLPSGSPPKTGEEP